MIASTSDVVHTTKNDLPETVRSDVIEILGGLLADAVDLQLQGKQAHWNVKGPDFLALHQLFDKMVEQVQEYADVLAERIVQLGGIAAGTARLVAAQTELEEYPATIARGDEHVHAVTNALASFGARVRPAIARTQEIGDAVTADLLTEVTRGVDKLLWFVEAHGQAER